MTEFWHCNTEGCTEPCNYQYKDGFYCLTHYARLMFANEWHPEDMREEVMKAKRYRFHNRTVDFNKKVDGSERLGYDEELNPLVHEFELLESMDEFFMMQDLEELKRSKW